MIAWVYMLPRPLGFVRMDTMHYMTRYAVGVEMLASYTMAALYSVAYV